MQHLAVRAAALGAATVAALALAGCGAPSPGEHQQRNFDLSGTTLSVKSDSNVEIVHGDADRVHVDRWLTGAARDEGNHSWRLSHGTLTMSLQCSGVHLDCGGHYRVAVPSDVRLKISSNNGEVSVKGQHDSVDVTTENGDIRLTGAADKVRVSTAQGGVTGEKLHSADVQAHSDNGDLALSFADAPKRVVVESNNGELTVTVPPGKYHTSAHTKNGGLQNKIGDSPSAERTIEASSDNGDVRLRTRS